MQPQKLYKVELDGTDDALLPFYGASVASIVAEVNDRMPYFRPSIPLAKRRAFKGVGGLLATLSASVGVAILAWFAADVFLMKEGWVVRRSAELLHGDSNIVIVVIAFNLLLTIPLASGFFFIEVARRILQPSALDILDVDARPPVLLLRAFSNDHANWKTETRLDADAPFFLSVSSFTSEQLFRDVFERVGPFVALEAPDDAFPKFGVARHKLGKEGKWKEYIVEMTQKCQLLVLIPGSGQGVRWEFQHIVDKGYLEKTLIILPKPEILSSHREDTWKGIAGSLAGTKFEWLQHAIDIEFLVALHFRPDGSVVTISSSEKTREALYKMYSDHLRRVCYVAVYGMKCALKEGKAG